MSIPTLTPIQQTSPIVLTSTGSHDDVASSLVFGVYSGSADFITGAVDQVAFTYKMLGGDVLDIELTPGNIYSAYETSCLEYSYIVNNHQAKNSLSNFLGATTASFDSKGQYLSGALSASLSGTNVALTLPKFKFEYAKEVANGLAVEAALGDNRVYSASITLESDVQDYDLQKIVQDASVDGSTEFGYAFTGSIKNKRIAVRRVYYKSPASMWRFYGYYGGLNVVGNLYTYGQYSDESTFEVVPAWQNKAQAMAFETNLYTRASHYSYEIRDNRIRLYPPPANPGFAGTQKIWFEFTVPEDSWESDSTRKDGTHGVNNYNTLPFTNIPYGNINSMGKQWIRRYALAVAKEMLAQVRGKFATVPIPGDSVTLNAGDLLSQAKEEQNALKEELKTLLDELTYSSLVEKDAKLADDSNNLQTKVPLNLYVG
jgi:hypothetical protein